MVVPSINIPCIYGFDDFEIEKLAPLFSYLLTKSESDLYPFALVVSLWDYKSSRFIDSQLVFLVH
jgi:hypothetical protein